MGASLPSDFYQELNTGYHQTASQIRKASRLTLNISQSCTYGDAVPGVRGNWWLGGSRLAGVCGPVGPETFALCQQVSVEADHHPAACGPDGGRQVEATKWA